MLRLSPQSQHTAEVVRLFDAVRRAYVAGGRRTGSDLAPGEPCNGYWHGKPGLEMVAPEIAR